MSWPVETTSWEKVLAALDAAAAHAEPARPRASPVTATAVKPAKGQPAPTDAAYKSQCQQQYNQTRDSVLQFLISSAWIEGESADNGVKMTDAEVKKEFDKQRQQSFPKDSDYLAFLKTSGYVQEDLLYRIKVQNLSQKLRTKILKGTDKVSDQTISSYYNKNKDHFAVPEKRDVRIVLTKDAAAANPATKNGCAKLVADHMLWTAQLKAIGVTLVLAVVGTVVIAYIVKAVIGLRPSEEVETVGLDLAEHGEEGYHG